MSGKEKKTYSLKRTVDSAGIPRAGPSIGRPKHLELANVNKCLKKSVETGRYTSTNTGQTKCDYTV